MPGSPGERQEEAVPMLTGQSSGFPWEASMYHGPNPHRQPGQGSRKTGRPG
jgi:hypothetical protein